MVEERVVRLLYHVRAYQTLAYLKASPSRHAPFADHAEDSRPNHLMRGHIDISFGVRRVEEL